MDISLLLVAITLGSSIQMCKVNGVPTYTDRSDICDAGKPVEFNRGTFSMVDARIIDETPQPETHPASSLQVIVERYIAQPIYLPQPQIQYLGSYRPIRHPYPRYPHLPVYRPSLYEARVGHAVMPHQRSPILGKRYQSGRNPAHRPVPLINPRKSGRSARYGHHQRSRRH